MCLERNQRRLAANYSAPLVCLLDRYPGLVDAVKVSEFDSAEHVEAYRELRCHRPLLLHGLAQAATPGEASFRELFRAEHLSRALEVTGAPYVSVHLEHRAARQDECGPETFLGRLAADLAALRQVSGLPIHLENIHVYRPRPGEPRNATFVGDPSFIAEAVARTGSRFLLDVAHAQVAAWHRGEPALAYVERLPLDLVDEVHLSGPVPVDGELRDGHGETTEEGYLILERVLERYPVKTVTLEYGGVGPLFEWRSDPAALLRQLERLRALTCR